MGMAKFILEQKATFDKRGNVVTLNWSPSSSEMGQLCRLTL